MYQNSEIGESDSNFLSRNHNFFRWFSDGNLWNYGIGSGNSDYQAPSEGCGSSGIHNQAVDRFSRVFPMKSCVLAWRNGSLLLSEYSPRWRRKKNAMTIMLHAARKVLSKTLDMTETAIRWRTGTGMGLTRRSVGSLCFHERRVSWIWKSMWKADLRCGSWAPTLRNIWATCRT